MDWREKLLLERRSNRSNVFLIETVDPERLKDVYELVRDIDNIYNGSYKLILDYDINSGEVNVLNRLYNKPNADPVEAMHKALRRKVITEPTILIVRWIKDIGDAGKLKDFIFSLAQDPDVYAPGDSNVPSTILVLTHSLAYFPENYRRFVSEIIVPLGSREERREALKEVAEAVKEAHGIEVQITEDVVEASRGLNLHEVKTAALKSIARYRELRKEVFTEEKIEILKRYGLEYIIPKYGFESVGGLNYLKNWFKRNLVDIMRNPELTEKYGASPIRGVLLYGYPGTGKSWFSKALARELGLPFIKLNAADFLRGIVGETEARTRQVIQLLETLAPAVVFIDEMDQLFLSRGLQIATDSGISRRLQNMLLEWLGDSERKTIVIGATNYVEQMDFAAIRVGRIDSIILVMPPDYEARKEIVRIHLEKIRAPKVPVEVDYDVIAKQTRMWTGAELEKLARLTKIEAMIRGEEKITTDLVLEILEKIRPRNLESRKERIQKMVEKVENLENYERELTEEALKVLREEVEERDKTVKEKVESRYKTIVV